MYRKSLQSTSLHLLLTFLFVAGLPGTSMAGWERTWIDSFDGTGVDWSNWTAQTQANYNNERQCYTDDESSVNQNYDVSGGSLKIIARRQPSSFNCSTIISGDPVKQWTSGRLNSKDKQEFLYGRIEARIKFSNLLTGGGTALSDGSWPAFWMLENRISEQPIKGDGDNVPWNGPGAGEIDVWEWVSKAPDKDSYVTNFYNSSGCGGLATYDYPNGADDVLDWHVYAIEWDADMIAFYVDDTLVTSYNVTSCAQYKEKMFLLLNVAIGGSFGGPIDDDLTQATMEVEYIAHCNPTSSNAATRCNDSTPLAAPTPTPTPTPTPPPDETSASNTAPRINFFSGNKTRVSVNYRYRLSPSDPEGDDINITAVSLPGWLSFDPVSWLLSGTPTSADVGDHEVIFELSDGIDSVQQKFTIAVLSDDRSTDSGDSSGGGGGSLGLWLMFLLGAGLISATRAKPCARR